MLWIFGCEACGILAPQPGMEPVPPTLEDEVLTTGLPGKSQNYCFFDTYSLTFSHFAPPFIIPFTFLFA